MEKKQVYGFEMIHADDMENIIRKERALIIDLRGEEQYHMGHIKNARNFPFEYIEEWKRELPEKMSLILYCEQGNQSLLAARKLKERKGAVYTLVGGYQAYMSKKDKTSPFEQHKKD